MFNVDDNHYYSSKTNNYIKMIYNNKLYDFNHEKKLVMLGFTIAIKTNRIFILPKFSCRNSLLLKRFQNRYCSYDELFDINALDHNLIQYYRENVYNINHLYICIAILVSQICS